MLSSQCQSVQQLLKSFPERPFDQKQLDDKVAKEVRKFQNKASPENMKSRWELVLRSEIFALAETEGQALRESGSTYYDDLMDRLDLVLTFTEHRDTDACDSSFPFTVLQDLLETQTIPSCSHIFSWIEARASRLTKGMVPQKGKALTLLRTLNDLLRRLSKMGSTTLFCGRISTFLSGVFPLGERSGVNLRGEYGPIWEGVIDVERGSDVDMKAGTSTEAQAVDKMDVDDKGDEEAKRRAAETKDNDFYNTFWSLQLPFSRPPLFANLDMFNKFKDAVDKVLPVIKEATTKDRAMMGNRAATTQTNPLKRKRDLEPGEETNSSDYFFAKFLTSPDLLSLEIADTHFRRQILFQLLVILQHLLTFTKTAKAAWATPRNRSLQMDFTLEPADAQWVQETITKTTAELRSTAPGGPTFTDTVNVIFDREKNWVRWKNDMCPPFDKEPWSEEVDGRKVGLEAATRQLREKMREEPPEWTWSLGSESLTEIWEMGYKDLTDLQTPFQAGDVKDFVKKVKQEDARIDMRKKALARTAERMAQARAKAAAAAAAASSIPPSTDLLTSAPLSQESGPPTADAAKPEASPQPVVASVASPMHPSLPPKPSTAIPPSMPAAPETGATLVPSSTSTAAAGTPRPSPGPAAPAQPVDEQLQKYEENKQRWAWLALRMARDQYLQHFGKIGTGDIILLSQEIEAEKEREREREKKEERTQKTEEIVPSIGGAGSERGAMTEAGENSKVGPASRQDAEGDVKMEDR
ncbi:hypothetical protein ID866_6671 [Astraeus odoratus]|nr:hypothetical protein ID866_6671 [Astraeus odoratus]